MGRSADVDCSVLVAVLNEERHIEESVEAMRRQRFAGELEFLFADGGSTDRTREILDAQASKDRRIHVIDNPHRVQASGLNLALARATGRWVAQFDGHAIYPVDYVARGVSRLQQGDTTWVSGPMVPRGRRPLSRAVALALGSPLGRGGSRKWSGASERDREEYELDSGIFCGVWARTTLEAYGGWDERFTSNLDSELAGRFLARGERLVCIPAMAAEYAPRDSLWSLWKQYRGYGEYRIRTARRHPRTLRRSHVLPPAMALDLAAAIVGPRRSRTAAKAGLWLYAGAVSLATIHAMGRAEHRRDATLVPLALATMHLANGVGMLVGVGRHGFPWAGLASVMGLDRLAEKLSPAPEPVHAPSLS